MLLQPKPYAQGTYIETSQGNKISKKSFLCGSRHIRLGGKCIIHDRVMVRADLADVRIGRYSVLSARVVLRPSTNHAKAGVEFKPIAIGEHVFIGENSVLRVSHVGSFVHVGRNCVISDGCVLHDCSRVADNAVLAPNTVVPAFHVAEGCPAILKPSTLLPECVNEMMQEFTVSYVRHFVAQP